MDTKWIKLLARAGYSARGIVYLIIGSFAFLAAFGGGGEKTGTKGALTTLLQQPFGTVLIYIMIVGLVGYVIWRLIQSLMDTDDHGWSPKGLAVRGGLLASAFTYTTLTLFALSLVGILSPRDSDSSNGTPVADYIAGFIGSHYVSLGLALIFAGVAGAHFWKAATQGYAKHFRAPDNMMKIIHPVSIIGLTARGLVFVVICVLLFYRYLNYEPSSGKPPGMSDVLTFVQDLPMGWLLLASLGAGIVLFAFYSLLEGRYRRINIEDAT